MKKILLIIIVLAIAGYLYFTRDNESQNVPTPSANEGASFQPDPSNAAFTFDDGEVTLSSGRVEKPVEPGSTFTEEISLLEYKAYGDLNADGRNDTALLLARYGGGSGTFIYLGAFVSGPVTYSGSRVFFLGDRIAPQSISINSGIITINYLDRGEDEPFSAEPTVPVSREFTYRNGTLEER